MKLVELKNNLLNFKGEEVKEQDEKGTIKPLIVSDVFANIISNAQSENSRKMADWAREAYKKQSIKIDKTDEHFLREFLETQKLSNLLKDQLLQCFDDAKEIK